MTVRFNSEKERKAFISSETWCVVLLTASMLSARSCCLCTYGSLLQKNSEHAHTHKMELVKLLSEVAQCCTERPRGTLDSQMSLENDSCRDQIL